jgi:hypothetical protein
MRHQQMLDVPNEVYDPLVKTTKLSGATPEQLAIDWLAAISRHAARDPAENWIGAIPTGVPDWWDKHDKYLGEGLKESQDNAKAGD